MKVYLRNKEGFSEEARKFYESNFTITNENEADIIVANDFLEADYPDKIVARNSTAEDGIVAKEIVSLRGEDLSDLKGVSELTWAMIVYCLRVFKGEEARGKTLGIIGGNGRIAKHLIEIAEFLGVNVITYDKND